ncbi:MAG: stage II sporulation protein M [Balneolaceae bacterium]|nr:stage II sporulation protein M [Balneolaceae bacterium]MBO6547569.1 stage II sporulation protein M [Balneolaceae bacterium]MBO6648080.1 stage II sporulation protein M [Balneolaceae bacterium]
MREVTFLRKNADKWRSFEVALKNHRKVSPDDLAELYIELNNDLAYAQSCFAESKTAQYLNDLSIQAHNTIYKNRKERSSRLITFWSEEVPELFSYRLKELGAAIFVFLLFCSIGMISQQNDASFARLILGDAYVNMTTNNIEQGDPLAVYKEHTQLNMFYAITFNNIRVSFINFILGIFTVFGTGWIMLKNGIMVGVFITFFQSYDLLSEAMLVIFIHGALELSAITISGAAGFTLGNSFIFSGTYKRSVAFMKGVKDGIKMLISLIPVFIAAGFLESFVTRYTEMPVFLSLFIIIGSFAFIIGYYIIMPVKIYLKRRQQLHAKL